MVIGKEDLNWLKVFFLEGIGWEAHNLLIKLFIEF
jgi:hypothetical protein